jgi:nucleoid-associated protein YgaU
MVEAALQRLLLEWNFVLQLEPLLVMLHRNVIFKENRNMPKYTTRQNKRRINKQQLEELLDDRELESVDIYKNYEFSDEYKSKRYEVIQHIWSQGDKLYKLAEKYYGDKSYFWMIGLYNKKPTDAHYKYGDIVKIPVDQLQLYRDMVK